jgi:hypothetical protein
VTREWPKTLYMPCLDFHAEVEDQANRWFDKDHIPERLHCVGWQSCERFQRTPITPFGFAPRETWTKYINMFVVEGPVGPRTNAQSKQMVSPGAFRTAINSQVRKLGLADGRGDTAPLFISRTIAGPSRGLWVQQPTTWQSGSRVMQPPPRTIFVMFMDFDAAHEAEVDAYRTDQAIPDLLSCSGFLSCERFKADSPDPAPDKPQRPKYLEIFDVESPEVLTSPAYQRNREAFDDEARRFEGLITVWGGGVYLQRPSPWRVEVSR